MKKLLLIHFNLFLLIFLFAMNGFTQALPDPGVDPLAPPDSIAQVNNIKKEIVNLEEPILPTPSAIPAGQLANNEQNPSAYKHEEKAKKNRK